jgi:hypothetical protein
MRGLDRGYEDQHKEEREDPDKVDRGTILEHHEPLLDVEDTGYSLQ